MKVTSENWRSIFKELLTNYAGAVISYENTKKREIYIPGRLEIAKKEIGNSVLQITTLIEQVLVMEKANAIEQYEAELEKVKSETSQQISNPYNTI